MIDQIISKFQIFRNSLFQLFPYRAGATMDLIDALAATPSSDSIVKLSLSDLFRRTYSSLTDVLSSLFRTDLKVPITDEKQRQQTFKVTQLLAQECTPIPEENNFALFAIDCTANPRIFSNKVDDRGIVHAPNHVYGQKPITIGHEYSVLVYLPGAIEDQNKHWVVPLSTRRVRSNQSGTEIGFMQFEEIVNHTTFKNHFCVGVTDAAYSTRSWVIGISKQPHAVQIARMRGNRKLYRIPPVGGQTRRGRPQLYGEELLLQDPSVPDLEEIATTTTRKGQKRNVLLQRWNNVIMQGSKDKRTHEHPFDVLRISVTDEKGNPVYKRPLWLMITGIKRHTICSKDAYLAYGRRYDIEHFFRFGKQRLGLVSSQTPETFHEENWHWIGLLAYNMLYYTRTLARSVRYRWEKKEIQMLSSVKRPSQVQRDYERIIRGIGTPAPIPKPRGKSPGRRQGEKGKRRPDRLLVRKSAKEDDESSDKLQTSRKKRVLKPKLPHIRRIWPKNRPAPMRC